MFLVSLEIFSFFILSGLVLPISNNRTNGEFLLAFLSQALWIFSVVGYLRYLTGVSAEFFLIIFTLVVGLRVLSNPLQPFITSSSSWKLPLTIGCLYIIFVITFGTIALNTGNYTELVPRAAFMGHDGIMAYNRWAIEFTRFEYFPYHSYYPTGFSAAWSIIYDLQDNVDNWLFPTIFMFSLLIFPVLTFGCFIADRNLPLSVIFASATIVIALSWGNRMTNGYMDNPAALLLFFGLFCNILAFSKKDKPNTRCLITGFFFLSIAAVTKQPGLIGLLFGFSILLILCIKQMINYNIATYLLIILIIPSLFSFGVFYVTGSNPLGEIELVRSLSDIYNAGILDSLSLLISQSNILVFGIICASCLWSIFMCRPGYIFSLICVVFAIIGFFAFHDCCSYAHRNSIWIYSFLFAAASPYWILWKIDNKPEKNKELSAYQIIITSGVSSFCFAVSISLINSVMPMEQVEAYFRDRIGGFEVHKILTSDIKGIEQNGILSFFKPLSFSTLVGPYHATLEEEQDKRVVISKVDINGYQQFCKNNTSDAGCHLSAILKERPCVRIMINKNWQKNIATDRSQQNIYEKYDLISLHKSDENQDGTYELFVSSLSCPDMHR